jgi:phosphoribosyl-ATP pyrophosphohydrolase
MSIIERIICYLLLLVMWKKFNLTPDQIYSELENREGKTGIRK